MTSPPQIIDWDLAVRLGTKLAGDGPVVERDEAARAVEELRAGAHRSTPLVAEFTGLHADADTAPVLVVDRGGWVQANADAFSTVLAPMVAKLVEKKPPSGVTLTRSAAMAPVFSINSGTPRGTRSYVRISWIIGCSCWG